MTFQNHLNALRAHTDKQKKTTIRQKIGATPLKSGLFPDIPEIDLEALILEGVKKMANDRPEDGYFHPSELDGCARHIYFNKLHGKPDNKKGEFHPKAKMSLFLGTQIHSLLELAIRQSAEGEGFSAEVPLVSEKERIKGTCDGILKIRSNSYVLEFKSCKQEYFEAYREAPDPKHVRQVHCYMFMTGIKVSYILYYAKDSNDMVQHRVEYDSDIMEPILDRLRYIRKAIVTRNVPDDGVYLGCQDMANLRKTCPNYKRCKAYETKGIVPDTIDTLMA